MSEKKSMPGSHVIPGELQCAEGDIEINTERAVISVAVANLGDRPIQVGSHYHFFEVNESLDFKRDVTLGYRLNIAAGTAIRFEPGQIRTVELVSFGGTQIIYGFQGKVMGAVDMELPLTGTDSMEAES
ncbi:urease subunit beta [uncultured Photobacterium sp.]|uniref:urease subunit beta n=1 Tax=uncultured Photobacterium sp. TaxID=173973 RepID=UPI002613ABC3|nr:urease subunit beta [uncultured Photobacterium sp.]